MPSMTDLQMRFMEDLRKMDNLRMGSLGCGVKAIPNLHLRRRAEAQCARMGWVQSVPRDDIWLRTLYLTTKGLHALQAAERRCDRIQQETG